MKKTLTLFLSLFTSLVNAQSEPLFDTSFYSTNIRYEYLVPKFEVGQKATFNVSKVDVDMENGDTTKNKKQENTFSYSVTGKNDTAFIVDLKLDNETWEGILFDKDQPEKIWGPSGPDPRQPPGRNR